MAEKRRFLGKSVVITGAAAGMGKAITKAFRDEGADIVAVDLNEEGLARLEREPDPDAEGRLLTLAGDISLQKTNEDMIDLAVNSFGKIDVLVNNAGIAGHSEPVTELTNEDWDRVMRVNLYGPMYAIRRAVTEMIGQENGGSIVTIASVAGLRGCTSSVQYTAAKHGLIGLCEHTAFAYMHQGIRCNIVCPGAIHTGMSSTRNSESPFGRQRIMAGLDDQMVYGEPTDIASAVLYLASDEAGFINGAKLVVDGGMTCS